MSTSYGYVCKSHDPELYSEQWGLDQKYLRTLITMVRGGEWRDTPNVLFPDGPEITPVIVGDFQSAAPVVWLREHTNCSIALASEYGEQWPLVDEPVTATALRFPDGTYGLPGRTG